VQEDSSRSDDRLTSHCCHTARADLIKQVSSHWCGNQTRIAPAS
jgi:hypothetical protein